MGYNTTDVTGIYWGREPLLSASPTPSMEGYSSTDNTTLLYNLTTIALPISLTYQLVPMFIVGTILFLLTLFTIFGNILVGIALFKFRSLRTVSNYLIGNLALSDCLLAITILPMSTVNEFLGYWVFGFVLCNFWLTVDILYCTASIWNLCLIAFDRYTATLYPVWYREKRSGKQAAMYIAFVWTFSIFISVPPLLGWTDINKTLVYDNNTQRYQCELFTDAAYVVYSACGSFYIPFLITTILYMKIFCVLRERMSRMRKSRAQRRKQIAQCAVSEDTGNTFGKSEITMEMSQMPTECNSCVPPEEHSSRSLFSTDSGEKNSDEHDSESPLKSPNPGYISSSEVESQPQEPAKSKAEQTNGGSVNIITNIAVNNETEPAKPKAKNNPKRKLFISPFHGATRKVRQSNSKDENNVKHMLSTPAPKHGGFVDMIRSPFRYKRRDRMRSSDRHKYDQREYRATIRMAIIIACFCGCWIGFFTLYLLGSLCPHCYVPRGLAAFFFWVGYANSTMNPILYTIFNEEFRKAFQKLLGCYVNKRKWKK